MHKPLSACGLLESGLIRCQRTILDRVQNGSCFSCGEVEVRLTGLLLSRSAGREYKVCFRCQGVFTAEHTEQNWQISLHVESIKSIGRSEWVTKDDFPGAVRIES